MTIEGADVTVEGTEGADVMEEGTDATAAVTEKQLNIIVISVGMSEELW